MNKMLLAAMTAMLMSGCTMIPDYLQPELPVLDIWQEDEALPPMSENGQKAAASIAWQSFFQSAGLQRAVQIALENNRDLRIAALNVEAAQALYRVERSDLFPAIPANAAQRRQKVTKAQSTSNPLFGSGREYITNTYEANVASTAFELDLFGRLRSENEAALEEYFATEAARDATHISLIAEVANAYLQWMADRKILQLTYETFQTQEKSFNLINTSYENGVASKLDLAQVRQAVESARTNHALYRRLVRQDENALLLLLGVKSFPQELKEYRLEDVRLMRDLPLQLPSEVLLTRPDVRQAEHQLKAANANIGAARAAFFPRISLTGSYGFASNQLSDLFTSTARGAWSFAPQITMPIFEGGRNYANLDYSKLITEVSVAQYEKAVQTAFKEVADELTARSTLDDELLSQRRLVEAIQDSYDLSFARYKEGIDDFLSVLDAQRSLFAAKQNLIAIEQQYYANMVNLYKVLGGGLMSQAEAKPAGAPAPVELAPEAEPQPEEPAPQEQPIEAQGGVKS